MDGLSVALEVLFRFFSEILYEPFCFMERAICSEAVKTNSLSLFVAAFNAWAPASIRSSLCEHPVMIIKVTPIIIVLSKVSVAFM